MKLKLQQSQLQAQNMKAEENVRVRVFLSRHTFIFTNIKLLVLPIFVKKQERLTCLFELECQLSSQLWKKEYKTNPTNNTHPDNPAY